MNRFIYFLVGLMVLISIYDNHPIANAYVGEDAAETTVIEGVGQTLLAIETFNERGRWGLFVESTDCHKHPSNLCVYFDIASNRILVNKNLVPFDMPVADQEVIDFVESIVDFHMEDVTKEIDEMTIEHPTITIEE